jgi:DNA-binding transcriptional MerR regulator
VKVGELSRQLGIDRTTVYEWLKIDGINQFLSTAARGEDGMQRVFSGEDADVINTIRHLKHQSRHITWDEIIQKLDEGMRVTLYPTAALRMDSRVVTVPQAEQAVELAKAQAERDAALTMVEDLQEKLTQSAREKDELRKELTQQIIELNRQIGRLEGMIEAQKNKNE